MNLELKKADIFVLVNGGKILPKGRLRQVAKTIKIENTKENKDLLRRAGALKIDLKQIFLAELSKNKESTHSLKETETGEQAKWIVADAGPSFWTLDGSSLSKDGILEFRVIGDDAICSVERDNKCDTTTLDVFIRVNLREIWVRKIQNQVERARFFSLNPDAEVIKNNRIAVARTLIARSLRNDAESIDEISGDGNFILSEHILCHKRPEKDPK